MCKMSKPKCHTCGRSLVAIGRDRENGKGHDDWESRNYHKSCFKNLIWKRTYYIINFVDKEDAKSRGARWDPYNASWYAPNDVVKMRLDEAGYVERDDTISNKNHTICLNGMMSKIEIDLIDELKKI